MVEFTSVELNYMVFRYMQESGLLHSAFTFGIEAGVNNSPIDGNLIPPETLIKLVQKGLLHTEMEANVITAENIDDEGYCHLPVMDLISKDINELQNIVNDKKKHQPMDIERHQEKDVPRNDQEKDVPRNDQEKQVVQGEGQNTGRKHRRRRLRKKYQ